MNLSWKYQGAISDITGLGLDLKRAAPIQAVRSFRVLAVSNDSFQAQIVLPLV